MNKMDKQSKTSEEIHKLIDSDTYWGEFSEVQMEELLRICDKDGFKSARHYIRQVLKREDFVFGRGRSDFLYYLDVDTDSVCLDCGAGLGVHTFNMAQKAKEVHAFDQSLKRLQFMAYRKKEEGFANVHLYHSDFEHLPFERETFDVILMNGVVEWLGMSDMCDNPRDDQVRVLTQLFKLLKPGGRLYIGIENRFALAYLRGRDHNGLRFTNYMPRFLADITTRWRTGNSYRTYTYSQKGYKRLLADSGFETGNTEFYIAYPGYNYPQYLIPFGSTAALRFFIRNFTQQKGLRGRCMRLCTVVPFAARFFRHTMWSFGIVARK